MDTPSVKTCLYLWWAVVNMLMYINNTVNFLLYSLSGSQFRQEMKRIFCDRNCSNNIKSRSIIPTRGSEANLEDIHESHHPSRKLIQDPKLVNTLDPDILESPSPINPDSVLSDAKSSDALKHELFLSEDEGDKAIRRIFFLVAHDYKDRIFKLVRTFRNLHGSVRKYINFSIGVTSQQFVALKFVKICVFRTHTYFSHFHTGYTFDQISRKCRCIFQRNKC